MNMKTKMGYGIRHEAALIFCVQSGIRYKAPHPVRHALSYIAHAFPIFRPSNRLLWSEWCGDRIALVFTLLFFKQNEWVVG